MWSLPTTDTYAIFPQISSLFQKCLFFQLSEKTLAEQQQKAAAEEKANNLVIKPIEEVMEEDITPNHKYNDLMEVDVDSSLPQAQVRHSFAARLGHAGLSPLVIGKWFKRA